MPVDSACALIPDAPEDIEYALEAEGKSVLAALHDDGYIAVTAMQTGDAMLTLTGASRLRKG